MWQMVNHMGTKQHHEPVGKKGHPQGPLDAVAVLCQGDQGPATLLCFVQGSMVRHAAEAC